MRVRNIQGEDYVNIHSVLNDWWGGRDMASMLPKLFFVHFQETSFIIEEDGKTLGFLCGFFSQTHKDEAYVHFIGVNPKFRRKESHRRYILISSMSLVQITVKL